MTKKVLVTGAAGLIASQVLPALRERYDLTLLDIRTTDRNGNPVEGVQIADLVNRDRDTYRHHFQGVDAVVHFGFVKADRSNSDTHFWAEFDNVQMAYNIYQTALEEGVKRVVTASSNHAADYYEALILDGKLDFVDPNGRAQSDNFYGWAKEVYEHLGFVFATGHQTGNRWKTFKFGSAGREKQMLKIASWAICAVCVGPWPSISATGICSSFLSKVSKPKIFEMSRACLSRFFTGLALTPKLSGASLTPDESSVTNHKTTARSVFVDLIAKHIRAATGD